MEDGWKIQRKEGRKRMKEGEKRRKGKEKEEERKLKKKSVEIISSFEATMTNLSKGNYHT